jgi:hypothetical protein
MDLYAEVPDAVIAATAIAKRNLRKTGTSAPDFIAALKPQNLIHFAAIMAKRLA